MCVCVDWLHYRNDIFNIHCSCSSSVMMKLSFVKCSSVNRLNYQHSSPSRCDCHFVFVFCCCCNPLLTPTSLVAKANAHAVPAIGFDYVAWAPDSFPGSTSPRTESVIWKQSEISRERNSNEDYLSRTKERLSSPVAHESVTVAFVLAVAQPTASLPGPSKTRPPAHSMTQHSPYSRLPLALMGRRL